MWSNVIKLFLWKVSISLTFGPAFKVSRQLDHAWEEPKNQYSKNPSPSASTWSLHNRQLKTDLIVHSQRLVEMIMQDPNVYHATGHMPIYRYPPVVICTTCASHGHRGEACTSSPRCTDCGMPGYQTVAEYSGRPRHRTRWTPREVALH